MRMNLAERVSDWLGELVVLERQVFSGEEAEVWRASSGGRQLAMHVSPPWRSRAELA